MPAGEEALASTWTTKGRQMTDKGCHAFKKRTECLIRNFEAKEVQLRRFNWA